MYTYIFRPRGFFSSTVIEGNSSLFFLFFLVFLVFSTGIVFTGCRNSQTPIVTTSGSRAATAGLRGTRVAVERVHASGTPSCCWASVRRTVRSRALEEYWLPARNENNNAVGKLSRRAGGTGRSSYLSNFQRRLPLQGQRRSRDVPVDALRAGVQPGRSRRDSFLLSRGGTPSGPANQ